MRRVVLALVLLAAGVGLGAWYWTLQSKTVKAMHEAAIKLKDIDIQAELDVDLSLKGIELSQGKAGQLHWRLKAKRAKYTQDRAEVQVENPEIEYYFEKDSRTLKVGAAHGVLEQGKDQARLWPEVRGAFEGNELRADELVYAGKERMLTLSGNVTIQGPRLSFKAAELKYLLANNEILAEKGISAVVMVPAAGMNRFGVLRGDAKIANQSAAPELASPKTAPTPPSLAPPATPTAWPYRTLPEGSRNKGATIP